MKYFCAVALCLGLAGPSIAGEPGAEKVVMYPDAAGDPLKTAINEHMDRVRKLFPNMQGSYIDEAGTFVLHVDFLREDNEASRNAVEALLPAPVRVVELRSRTERPEWPDLDDPREAAINKRITEIFPTYRERYRDAAMGTHMVMVRSTDQPDLDRRLVELERLLGEPVNLLIGDPPRTQTRLYRPAE